MGKPVDSTVTITACAAVTALGDGLAPLERALADNATALRSCARFAGNNYQTDVVSAVPDALWDELRRDDPARADAPAFLLAHRVIRQLRPHATGRVGLVLSTTKADITALERLHAGQPCSDAARRHLLPGQLAADLAAANNMRGPVRCISVACVSGLLAIQTAAEMLQRAEADAVIVAGVDLLSHFVLAGFTALKSLDPDGCRPFDKDRTGLSLGEGAAAVLLVRGSGMTVAGWGSSNDANHLTGPSRDGSGLVLAINRALQRAAVATGGIDYLHAHGTGTLYNDNMESLALRTVFGKNVPPCSSSKGIFGHTLGAAGVLETILCLLAARSNTLPGTPRLLERDPVAPQSMLLRPQPATRLRCMLKINSGFGGANAALVLRKDPA